MHPSSSLRFLNMRCQLSWDFLRNGFGPRIHQIDRITKIAHNANSGCQHNVRGTSVGTPRGSRQRNGFMWHPVHRHWEACCACDIYSHGPVAPLKKKWSHKDPGTLLRYFECGIFKGALVPENLGKLERRSFLLAPKHLCFSSGGRFSKCRQVLLDQPHQPHLRAR